jgi:mRNA interferase MazF
MNRPHIRKGDLVLVDIPYLDATQAVKRPALVICDPTQMLDIVIAGITSRIRKPLPATHYPITHKHPDWAVSGLRLDSAVRCDRIFTIESGEIHRVIGSLSLATILEIDAHVKRALGIA